MEKYRQRWVSFRPCKSPKNKVAFGEWWAAVVPLSHPPSLQMPFFPWNAFRFSCFKLLCYPMRQSWLTGVFLLRLCVTVPARFLQEKELPKPSDSWHGPVSRRQAPSANLEQGLPLVASWGTAGHFWSVTKPLATEDYLKQFFVRTPPFLRPTKTLPILLSFYFFSCRGKFWEWVCKKKRNTECVWLENELFNLNLSRLAALTLQKSWYFKPELSVEEDELKGINHFQMAVEFFHPQGHFEGSPCRIMGVLGIWSWLFWAGPLGKVKGSTPKTGFLEQSPHCDMHSLAKAL